MNTTSEKDAAYRSGVFLYPKPPGKVVGGLGASPQPAAHKFSKHCVLNEYAMSTHCVLA